MKNYWIYILSNKNRNVLYIGMTNDLIKRLYQHKNKLCDGFTSKYNVNKLLYFEKFNDPINAITREKQLKRWNRAKKDFLINSLNPDWEDLSKTLNLF